MEADEPWQALACCMEIARAVRAPNPAAYISHFPVHQVSWWGPWGGVGLSKAVLGLKFHRTVWVSSWCLCVGGGQPQWIQLALYWGLLCLSFLFVTR